MVQPVRHPARQVVALLRAKFRRTPKIGGVDHVIGHRLLRQQREGGIGRLHAAAQEPPASAAQTERQHHRGRGAPSQPLPPQPLLDQTLQAEPRRDRFRCDRSERGPQRLPLGAPRGDLPRDVRMFLQVALHRGPAIGVQLAVDVGVQLLLGDRPSGVAHLTLRSAGLTSSPPSVI